MCLVQAKPRRSARRRTRSRAFLLVGPDEEVFVYMTAQRPLKKGEELVYNYGVSYWRHFYTPVISLPDRESATNLDEMD